MPEARLAKTRATLPEGYRFGDARPCGVEERAFFKRRTIRLGPTITVRIPRTYRPSETAHTQSSEDID